MSDSGGHHSSIGEYPAGDNPVAESDNPTGDNPVAESDNPTGDNPVAESDNPVGDNPVAESDNPAGDNPVTESDNPTGDNPVTESDNPTGDNPVAESDNPAGDVTGSNNGAEMQKAMTEGFYDDYFEDGGGLKLPWTCYEYPPFPCDRCMNMNETLYQEKASRTDEEEALSKDYEIIHISALWDHFECVHFEITQGVDINLPASDNNWTPLFLACAMGNTYTAWLLAKFDANVNWDDGRGHTPLLISVLKGHYDCADVLLQYGADANYRAEVGEQLSPLMVAISAGDVGLIKILVDYDAKFNLYAEDPNHFWDRFSIQRSHKDFSTEDLEEILMMIHDQEGALTGSLFGALFNRDDPDLLKRILDKNMILKQSADRPASPILDPENADWLMTVLAMSDDTARNLVALLEYETDGKKFVEENVQHLTKILSWACDWRQANPLNIHTLLEYDANPDGEKALHPGFNCIFNAMFSLSQTKGGLEIVVMLIKYNCDLNINEYGTDRNTGIGMKLTLQEHALAFENLYLAQVLFLAGMHNCRGIKFVDQLDGQERDGYKCITHRNMRCSKEERDDFIKRHLSAPPPLFNLSRVALRRALGRYPDRHIPKLGLDKKVESFVMYDDLDRLAARFSTAFERLANEADNEP